MASTDHHGGVPRARRGYETKDLNVRWITILTVAFIVSLPFVLWSMKALFDHLAARETRNQPRSVSLIPRETNPLPPVPRLQSSPTADLAAHRAEEKSKFEGYAWIDRGNGRVRIPVERAMELLVERGLPARPVAPAADPKAAR